MNPTSCHGVLMEIGGHGVLFRGPPGCGKSELAMELLSRGHRLVADDVVLLSRRNDVLIGCGPEEARGMLAVRGLGILDAGGVFGHGSIRDSAIIDLVVEHQPQTALPDSDDLLGQEPLWATIASVVIPKLFLKGMPGSATLPTRAECLVRNFALRKRGRSAKERLSGLSRPIGARSNPCD